MGQLKLHPSPQTSPWDEELSKGWGQIVPTLLVDTPGGKQNMGCANVEFDSNWGTICTPLELIASDGKQKIGCANAKIISSPPPHKPHLIPLPYKNFKKEMVIPNKY